LDSEPTATVDVVWDENVWNEIGPLTAHDFERWKKLQEERNSPHLLLWVSLGRWIRLGGLQGLVLREVHQDGLNDARVYKRVGTFISHVSHGSTSVVTRFEGRVNTVTVPPLLAMFLGRFEDEIVELEYCKTDDFHERLFEYIKRELDFGDDRIKDMVHVVTII
jgi:hypothetical protein